MDYVNAWSAGQTVRKHTMYNIRAENIAEHTWGVVSLLAMCWSDVPYRVVINAQFHDFGEDETGDMPGNVKWGDPVFGQHLDKLEQESRQRRLPEHVAKLCDECSPDEIKIIEIFDRLEFCVSMIREASLGNLNAEVYFDRSMKRAEDLYRDLFTGDVLAEHQEVMMNLGHLLTNIVQKFGGVLAR